MDLTTKFKHVLIYQVVFVLKEMKFISNGKPIWYWTIIYLASFIATLVILILLDKVFN
jgi:hypothetical protein